MSESLDLQHPEHQEEGLGRKLCPYFSLKPDFHLIGRRGSLGGNGLLGTGGIQEG